VIFCKDQPARGIDQDDLLEGFCRAPAADPVPSPRSALCRAAPGAPGGRDRHLEGIFVDPRAQPRQRRPQSMLGAFWT
jgi:hypothetical protein